MPSQYQKRRGTLTTRREFLSNSLKLGVGLGLGLGASGGLAACGPAPAAPAPATSAPADSGGQAAAPASGETATINAVFISGENDETALRERVADVKSAVNVNVNVADLGFQALYDKLIQGFQAGQSAYDVVAIVGFWLAATVGSQYLEPLEPYVKNADLTPADWDFNDFVDKHLDYISYWSLDEARPGRPGELFLIPGPHSDACIVTYRKDLLEAKGLKPPETWDEYTAVVKALHDPSNEVYGTAIIGKNDPSLALVDWHNRFLSLGGTMLSGSPKDKTLTPNLNSPESIAAIEHIVEMVEYSPPGVSSYGLTELSDAMATGKLGMVTLWAVVSGRWWVPDLSKVSDKIGVTLIPGLPEHRGKSTRGGWGMGIPKDIKNKEAAWEVIQWYSSKEIDKYRVMNYGLSPVRNSTIKDPEVVAKFPFMPTLGELLQTAVPYASIIVPESLELLVTQARILNQAVVGELKPADAAKSMNDEWTTILKRGGWLA
ncbi:MAG: sugar ABC transporter substrate-binding protein [Chloroflexi bacterium]|nr:sugar ABC transporter substrate-binding protein [Chloroflexota bacterium]